MNSMLRESLKPWKFLMKILNISDLERIDSQKMYKIYDDWPKIALESFSQKIEQIEYKNIEHIVFAGMGGSGSIGDIFSSILSKSRIHVNVVKGYLLPRTVSTETLVVVSSVSGNTIETLTVLESAKTIGCRLIAFSSGGKIGEFCEENKIQHVKIPLIHSPRASFTSYLYTMLKILQRSLKIKESEILESITELEKTKQIISSSNLTKDNAALNLARWITGIPLIYYPFGLESAAIRFKNSLQENAKMHIFTEDVIEACHNGVVSWEKKSNVSPILIIGQDDHIKTKERWDILKEFFVQNEIKYKEVSSNNGGILSKIINLIYFLDYTTIYKAIIDEVDPSPVKSIDFIKSKLK